MRRKIGPVRPRGTREGLTNAQAEAALRQLMTETTPEQVAPETRANLEEAGVAYIAYAEQRGRKATTLTDYRTVLRRHLVPFFGAGALNRITVDDVERYVAVKSRTLAPNTVVNHLNFLHAIFEHGRHKRRGWASSNPVAEIENRPEVEINPDIVFLTAEEIEALIRAAPDDLEGPRDRALYATAGWAGLRQGELAGLRWQDVDFDAMKIRVRRSFTHGQLTTPKSRRSLRAVPMSDRLGAELDRLSRASAFTADDDLVFAHPQTGNYFDASHVRKRFEAALERAELQRVRFHNLRHSFGTAMARAGCPMFELAGYMGHASVTTTEKHYAAFAPDEARGAMYADRAFGPAVISGEATGRLS